jgi:hypothetical protein
MLYIGENAAGSDLRIDNSNIMGFAALRNKDIGTIWIHGCLVAATTYGRSFWSLMARVTGCDVVAADSIQRGWWAPAGAVFMPSGNIDDYDGTVYRFDPAGNQETFYPNGGSF